MKERRKAGSKEYKGCSAALFLRLNHFPATVKATLGIPDHAPHNSSSLSHSLLFSTIFLIDSVVQQALNQSVMQYSINLECASAILLVLFIGWQIYVN